MGILSVHNRFALQFNGRVVWMHMLWEIRCSSTIFFGDFEKKNIQLYMELSDNDANGIKSGYKVKDLIPWIEANYTEYANHPTILYSSSSHHLDDKLWQTVLSYQSEIQGPSI